VVLSGIVTPACLSHADDLLAEFARILKPSGLVIIREPVVEQGIIYMCKILCYDCSIRVVPYLAVFK